MESPSPGMLLIADPFLKDPHFARSVVLLCEHQEQGSFGFVINKRYKQTLNELVPDMTDVRIPVYYGGPVQLDTIHFVHQIPDLVEGGFEIIKGIYWGGKFDRAISLINDGLLNLWKIKFFIGYSGWSSGQLEEELNERSWILSQASSRLLFKEKEQNIWPRSLKELGNDYAMMANFPIDPSLN